MAQTYKLPTTIIRDIINNLEGATALQVMTHETVEDLADIVCSHTKIDLATKTVTKRTAQIIGQYRVGSSYTKANRVKVNTTSFYPSQMIEVISDSKDNSNYSAGKFNSNLSYLLSKETAKTTSNALVITENDTVNKELIITLAHDIDANDLVHYQPKSLLALADYILETIVGLQVKAAYYEFC